MKINPLIVDLTCLNPNVWWLRLYFGIKLNYFFVRKSSIFSTGPIHWFHWSKFQVPVSKNTTGNWSEVSHGRCNPINPIPLFHTYRNQWSQLCRFHPLHPPWFRFFFHIRGIGFVYHSWLVITVTIDVVKHMMLLGIIPSQKLLVGIIP